MCAHADECWLRLKSAEDLEQPLTSGFVVEPRIELRIHPAWTFDREKVIESQPGSLDLWSDLLRSMQVCSGKPVGPTGRILVDAISEISVDDRRKRWIPQRPFLDSIARRRKARDVRREKYPAWNQNSSSLAESLYAFGWICQVIERTEQQRNIECSIRDLQSSCVPDLDAGKRCSRGARQLPRPINVPRHRIDEMHFVAATRERKRVDPGTSTNVEHAARRGRQMALENLPRSNALETAE